MYYTQFKDVKNGRRRTSISLKKTKNWLLF